MVVVGKKRKINAKHWRNVEKDAKEDWSRELRAKGPLYNLLVRDETKVIVYPMSAMLERRVANVKAVCRCTLHSK